MSDAAAATTPAGKGKWTDAENYSLVYQIVQQLLTESKVAIKFDQIQISGRSARALSERWAKIKTDVQAAGVQTGPRGEKAVRTPRKKKVTTEGVDGEEETPKKRARTPKKLAAKAVVVADKEMVTPPAEEEF